MGLRIIVCLFVYKRRRIVEKWLRAWNNADQHDAKLAVFHNFDGSHPDPLQVRSIMNYHPDFYIPRVNIGGDIGAFQDFIKLSWNWDVVCCFAEDVLPMRKDFLDPFIEKISNRDVGMVGAFFETAKPLHMRTVAFCIKKIIAKRVKFPYLLSQRDCMQFEHGTHNFYKQVIDMGYKVDLAYGDLATPWCQDQSLLWDVDHCFNHNLWDKFEEQFIYNEDDDQNTWKSTWEIGREIDPAARRRIGKNGRKLL